MKQRINVLYATKVNVGGWATFTVHLVNLLRQSGHPVSLLRVGNRTETFDRPFSDHGLRYRNVAPEDLADEFAGSLNIVSALGKHYVDAVTPLLSEPNTGIVVHDPAEPAHRIEAVKRPWVIRRAVKALYEDAVFIRHPYVPHGEAASTGKRKGFISTSRVDFDKNTTMILDANRLGADVECVGFENRLYAKFKIMPHYPEWEQSGGKRPNRTGSGYEMLRTARGMVDLSDIKGDGGGTQYTFLEAWDAGAVPVIGKWWLRKGDDMVDGKNCYAVGDATELAKLLKRWPSTAAEVAAAGRAQMLRNHGKRLVPQIISWLEGL